MKKTIATCTLVFVAVLGLTASGMAEKPVVLKFGHIFTPTSAIHHTVALAAELMDHRSNGRLKMNIYPGAQLGKMLDQVEGTKMGTQDLTVTWGIDRFCPEFSLFNYPFVFRDEHHLYRVLNSELGQKYVKDKMLQRHGIRIVGMIYHGVRMLTTNEKNPVTKPEDVKGLRLRTPDITGWIKAWQSIEANVTAFAWGELYMALKQGIVDAQENPLASIRSMKFYEVQKNIILTGHIIDYPFVMINDKKFQSLGKEFQDILVKAFEDVRYYSVGLTKEEANENIKFFQEKGLNIVTVDREEWRKAFSKAPDLFKGGREVYNKVQAIY